MSVSQKEEIFRNITAWKWILNTAEELIDDQVLCEIDRSWMKSNTWENSLIEFYNCFCTVEDPYKTDRQGYRCIVRPCNSDNYVHESLKNDIQSGVRKSGIRTFVAVRLNMDWFDNLIYFLDVIKFQLSLSCIAYYETWIFPRQLSPLFETSYHLERPNQHDIYDAILTSFSNAILIH